MLVVPPHLRAALRRVRLESAVSLAQHNRLPDDDQARLQARLDAARTADEAEREGGNGRGLPLATLARRLALRPVDEFVLLAAVALELDPLFAITLSALAGEEPRQGLSAKLLAQLMRFAGDEALELALDGQHPLVEAGLLESVAAPGVPESLRPWRVAARAVSFLAGADEVDPLLTRLGGVVPVPDHADFEYARTALDLVERVFAAGEDVIVCVEGADGVGRRTVIAAAARATGRSAIAVDAGRLSPERARFVAELRALRRECWLRDAVPVVARVDALARRDKAGDRLIDLAEALESPGAVRGPAVLTIVPGTDLPDFQRRIVRLRLDPPGPVQRAAIWRKALGAATDGGALAGDDAALAQVVQTYALTPGGIQRAAANTRMLARGRAVDASDVRAGVAAEIQERFSGLATRVIVTQGWPDLVLPQDTLDDIRAFVSRAANAAIVYDRWGFRDKLGRGLGLAGLFSGPPGTGKTMVAGLIAQSLGLELYQVDLSQVVSKWVGETEKQLGKIFDAAAMGQALLLFDEADALFAKRTEVKSSNDRYANLEVNYLLQRIEAFGGVAILTTNLEASVDPAFKRRLAADIRFYPPERDERERLWRTLIPSQAPVSSDVDYADLADRYKDMCGGHIRNAVLRAAFLAAAEVHPAPDAAVQQTTRPGAGTISHELLHRAARSEYRAMGKVL